MTTPAIRLMTDAEARACVAKINAGLTDVRSLVYELYERQGWSAMGYASWRECVNAEFPSSQSYLYRQLEAAQTEKVISPTGENQIPERQLRPLTKLRNEPEKQRIAWQQAVSTAKDGKLTAAHIAKIVRGMTDQTDKQLERELQKRAEKKEIRFEMGQLRRAWRMAPDSIRVAFLSWIRADEKKLPTGAKAYAGFAKEQLRRITDDDPDRQEALGSVRHWLDACDDLEIHRYNRAHVYTNRAKQWLWDIKPDDEEVVEKMEEMIRFCEELKTKAKKLQRNKDKTNDPEEAR